MSAWIVNKEHIDYLIAAAMMQRGRTMGAVVYGYGTDGEINPRSDPDTLGRALWTENVRSVAHRYPNDAPGGWPGPNGLDWETVATYRYAPPAAPLNIVAALKQVSCYEYQSCEHPAWRESRARAFCDQLRGALIGELPGYDDAPWGIDPEPDPSCEGCGAERDPSDQFCPRCGTRAAA